jgi:hypothetical protein
MRVQCGTGQLKCDGTQAETRFCLSAKRTSPFKSAGASVQSTAGSQGACISSSNAGYTTFRGSVKGTGYQLHSPVSPSLPLQCVTVCHHISTGVYHKSSSNFLSCVDLYVQCSRPVIGRCQVHILSNLPYFPAHKTHRDFFVRNFRKK